eukprot:176837-Prorocentrum_minimum.AAC.1
MSLIVDRSSRLVLSGVATVGRRRGRGRRARRGPRPSACSEARRFRQGRVCMPRCRKWHWGSSPRWGYPLPLPRASNR